MFVGFRTVEITELWSLKKTREAMAITLKVKVNKEFVGEWQKMSQRHTMPFHKHKMY